MRSANADAASGKSNQHSRAWIAVLTLSCLLPVDYIGHNRVLLILSPSILIVFCLLLPKIGRVRAVDMLLWLAFLASASGSSKSSTALVWALLLPVCLFAPSRLLRADTVARLRRLWAGLGSVLGVYAAVETWLLHKNPLFDGIYIHAAAPLTQQWSTYRATTTIGHPLLNGSFFAVAALLALGCWIRMEGRRFLCFSGLALMGLIASGSRSGLLALGAGLFFVLPDLYKSDLGRERGRPLAKLLVFYSFLAGSVALVLLGGIRSGDEASSSVAAHGTAYGVSGQILAAAKLLGSGPGQLPDISSLVGDNRLVESYWLDAALSVGVLGLLLLMLFVLSGLITGLQRGNFLDIAALLALCISISFYKPFTGHPFISLWLGILVAFARSGSLPNMRISRNPSKYQQEALEGVS